MVDIAYGDDLRGFIKLESSYGIPLAPAAADAFKCRTIALADADRAREDPMDTGNTHSVIERAERRHSATWSVTTLLRPSGALGTLCDAADLFELAFGTETENAATSVVYSQLKDRTALSATIWSELSKDNLVEFVRGAICQRVRISWGGSDWIVLEFSGIAKEFGETALSLADGAGTSTAALTVDDLDYFSEYSLVQIGTDTNGGSGYFITSLAHATESGTLSAATTWANGATVSPYLPTPTYSGSLVPYGTKVTTSLDGGSTTQQALGGELTIETGMGLLNEEEGSTSPTEPIIEGKWRVSGNMSIVVRRSDVHLFSQARRQVQKDCQWTFGDTAGYIMRIDADQVEFDPSEKNIPDTGLVRIDMPFEALGSTGEDNLTITMV